MQNEHSEESLRVSLAELRGQLEGINVRIALQSEESARDRASLRADLETFKEIMSDKVGGLQREVSVLIGKWAVGMLLIAALIGIGISNTLDTNRQYINVEALPPKAEQYQERIEDEEPRLD